MPSPVMLHIRILVPQHTSFINASSQIMEPTAYTQAIKDNR